MPGANYFRGLVLWFEPDGIGADVIGGIHRTTTERATGWQDCIANPNSTGERGFLIVGGDQSPATPKKLIASRLPLQSVGFFLVSRDNLQTPNPGGSQGILCLGGSIGRYSSFATSSGTSGSISLTIDPTAMQTPTGPVAAMSGETWYFQAWHRDSLSGTATSNFTNSVAVPMD